MEVPAAHVPPLARGSHLKRAPPLQRPHDPAAASLCTSEIYDDYALGPQEVCLDVSGGTPPRMTFWATGASGADCRDKKTLTAASALYAKADWASADNQPIGTATHYAKINNTSLATLDGVAVSSRLVLP